MSETEPSATGPGCCIPGRAERLPVSPASTVRAAAGMAMRARPVALPGGRVQLGTDEPALPGDGEGPARRIRLKPFRMDAHAVTVQRFAAFVAATGHRTDAERYGWSLVFTDFVPDGLAARTVAATPWWHQIHGADWAHPEGPDSGIDGREQHPVTHVSWNDANAFARWCGGRLPSEAEWEHAAAGGIDGARFPWGAAEPDENDLPCNIWRGTFPERHASGRGCPGTVPVQSYAPNNVGLYQASGNVWEWCADLYRLPSNGATARRVLRDSRKEGIHVLKGGSYLCHRSYCYRYRIAARTGVRADSSTGHVGLRVAFD